MRRTEIRRLAAQASRELNRATEELRVARGRVQALQRACKHPEVHVIHDGEMTRDHCPDCGWTA